MVEILARALELVETVTDTTVFLLHAVDVRTLRSQVIVTNGEEMKLEEPITGALPLIRSMDPVAGSIRNIEA